MLQKAKKPAGMPADLGTRRKITQQLLYPPVNCLSTEIRPKCGWKVAQAPQPIDGACRIRLTGKISRVWSFFTRRWSDNWLKIKGLSLAAEMQ